MRKDPYFDYGQALLQIAIVLASVSIITGGTSLLVLSGILAAGAAGLDAERLHPAVLGSLHRLSSLLLARSGPGG